MTVPVYSAGMASTVAAVRRYLYKTAIPAALSDAAITNYEVFLGHPGKQMPNRTIVLMPASGPIRHTDAQLGRRARGSVQESYDLQVSVSAVVGDQDRDAQLRVHDDVWNVVNVLDDWLRRDHHQPGIGFPLQDITLASFVEDSGWVTEGRYWEVVPSIAVTARV